MPDRRESPRIAIVGAGIGGLAAGIALRQRGFRVGIYEQAAELAEIGAGVAIGANGARVLHGMGLISGLRPLGVRPATVEFRHWDDASVIFSHPVGDWYEKRFGAPFYTLHRADLQALLRDRFIEAGGDLHLGRRLVSLSECQEGGELAFDEGDRVAAGVVIGADGVHSRVRAAIAGEDRATFSGTSGYRGLVPVERLPFLPEPDRGVRVVLGPRQHLVAYPVSGGRLVNFLAVLRDPEWKLESWVAAGEVKTAVAAFDGWSDVVTGIIGGADRVSRWALYDREPLRRWGRGRITLLGDAAHPMLPHHGQGANQALEDAIVLAGCLAAAGSDDPAAALRRYESLRGPRTRRMQLASRRNADCFHLPDGPEAEARNARLATLATDIAWIHGYDAGQAVVV